MKAVRQARLELSGGSTPDQLKPLVLPLRASSCKLTIMMYADDLIIFIEGEADSDLLKSIWSVIQQFGHFSGLKMNLKKTAAIVRNRGGHEWAACISRMGVEVKHFVKYLGIRLGNTVEHDNADGWGLTQDEAFTLALQEVFWRAKVVSTLHLSLDERVFTLCSRILPVVSLVAQVFDTLEVVVRQLKLVYQLTRAQIVGG